MFPTAPVLDAWRASTAVGQMMAETQWVIALRLWGFAGAWSLPPGEAERMMSEKGPAWMAAWQKAAEAMASGAGPAVAAQRAALRLHGPARANRRRLVRGVVKG